MSHSSIALKLKRQRQLARRRGLPGTITLEEWERALGYFNGHCAACGVLLMTDGLYDPHLVSIDHWLPLSRGGGSTAENIVPLCRTCNMSKGNKMPMDWLREVWSEVMAVTIQQRIERYFEQVRQWAAQSGNSA